MGGMAMFGNPPPPGGGGLITPPFPQGGGIPSLIGQPAPPGPPIPSNIGNLGAPPSYTSSIQGPGGQNMFYDPSTGGYDLSSPGGSVIPGMGPSSAGGAPNPFPIIEHTAPAGPEQVFQGNPFAGLAKPNSPTWFQTLRSQFPQK